MKNLNKLFFILTSIVFLTLAACSPSQIHEKNLDIKDDRGNLVFNSNKALAMEDYRKLKTYPDLDLYFKSFSDDQYRYSYYVAETKSDKINQEIKKWIEDEKDSFIKASKNLKDREDGFEPNLHIKADARLLNKEEKIYSLVFKEAVNLGPSHKEETIKTFNFNIEKEEFLTLDDIVDLSQEEILEAVKEKVEEDERLKGLVDPELLEKAMNDKDLDFSLGRGRLDLNFDQGQIGPEEEGPITIGLDFGPLKLRVKEEAKNILTPAQVAEIKEEEKELAEKKEREESEKLEESEKEEIAEESPVEDKTIALTFDDGPHPTNTMRLLDILDEYGAKATFFILGENASRYPEVVAEIAARGHEIAAHSYSHPDLTTLSYEGVVDELSRTNAAITDACGVWPVCVRPPYGATNDTVSAAIADSGHVEVHWSMDTADWQSRDPVAILGMVQEYAEDGDIVLMHDIHESTIDSIPSVIEYLRSQGFAFKTVSEIR